MRGKLIGNLRFGIAADREFGRSHLQFAPMVIPLKERHKERKTPYNSVRYGRVSHLTNAARRGPNEPAAPSIIFACPLGAEPDGKILLRNEVDVRTQKVIDRTCEIRTR